MWAHDPVAFVISLNLKRRHMDESQRGMVVAKLATLTRGRPSPENPPIGGLKTEDAARMLNVGSRTVERAKTVLRDGAPELKRAVEAGKIKVSAAADIATQPTA